MGDRQTRLKVTEGIYKDQYGFAATVKLNGVQREKRFAPDADLAVIQAWRDATRGTLRTKGPDAPRKGTVAGDADRYLAQIAHLGSADTRGIEIRAWVAEPTVGPVGRDKVTAEAIRLVRAKWLKAGYAPKTVNNRVNALRAMYHTLDGRRAATPCDDVPNLHVQKTRPKFVTDDLIVSVDAQLQAGERIGTLRDAKTRARFRVLASCGRRPCEVMRAEPGDLDFDRRVWMVRDAKGGDSPGLYLNDDMLAAWRFFVEVDAWGEYNTGSMARVLRTAGWPDSVRPYNLRHTTWMTASERGADLRDIQHGAGHKRAETTENHYTGILNSRMQTLSERIDGRFSGWGREIPPPVSRSRRVPARVPAETGSGASRRVPAGRQTTGDFAGLSETASLAPVAGTKRKIA